jgi:phenylacetate-CoA ligase
MPITVPRIIARKFEARRRDPRRYPPAWTICAACRLPRPMICVRAIPFRCGASRSRKSSAFTPAAEQPGNVKTFVTRKKIVDDWAHFFARCYRMAGVTEKDRVQIAVGYGVWTAGVGFQAACEKVGAMALPAGPGNVDLQCQFMLDLQSTVLCCTASMGLLLAEEINRRGLTDLINVRKIIYGSERSSQSMRQKISSLLGGAELFDITGLTELYGPGTGIECPDHDCIHYWADYYLLEILNPETLEPVEAGEWGEMVVTTTLAKEAVPLIRYRTHDITRILPGECSCGSIMPRHSRIMGRTDDMFIFRAVNIYPSHIDTIISSIDGLGSEYQIHLTRDAAERGNMRIVTEISEQANMDRNVSRWQRFSKKIKRELMVTPEVELVPYGSLPRSERKSQRVFDTRIQDSII